MEEKRQFLFRYTDKYGRIKANASPNGSIDYIAGICNEAGNLAGMMPHPERAGEKILGSADGLIIFKSILNHLISKGTVNHG